MDNIDKLIISIVTKEIDEPNEIKIMIKNDIYSYNIKNNLIHKIIAFIIAIILSACSIAYAGYIINKNVFNNRKGVERAIEENYIIYGNDYIESNNIKIKIDNYIIDDKNILLNFKILQPNNEVEKIQFEKILITDEEKRILYSNDIEQFNKYNEENNLNLTAGNFNDRYINSSTSIKLKNISDNEKNLIYNIETSSNYPSCKEINIFIENIILSKNNSNDVIEGKWILNEKIPEIFQDRPSYKYQLKNKEEEIIDIEANVYNTQTSIKIIMKNDNNNSIENEINIQDLSLQLEEAKKNNDTEKINEIGKIFQRISNGLSNQFSELYIENSMGERFYISDSENLHGGTYNRDENNNIIYNDIIDLTLYDLTNELTIHFKYNEKEFNKELIK